MKKIRNSEDVINSSIIKPGSRIYCSGNAATPQMLLKQLAADTSIRDVELLNVLLLGDVEALFSEECCQRIRHRVIFNGHLSRKAVNLGWADYQMMHLSDIPRQLRENIKPNVVFVSVSGPDNGGNYSLGSTVEGMMGAIWAVKRNRGLVIAERNAQMPFVLGTTIHANDIDYRVDTDYNLPVSPVKTPDERAKKIGNIIAQLYVSDGSTLQYGIGEVPEVVTDAIFEKGVNHLGIHTELLADAMMRLIDEGIVTNRFTFMKENFSLASIFLSGSQEGYDWLSFNSSVQSRPSDYTNSIRNIARQPNMVAINSAIGVDLHGNVWADSLQARNIYSGVGGQADFLRGAYLSEGGVPIIALKSTTRKGISKIVNKCPEGITTTAISADPVVIVTENGAVDPGGLGLTERSVALAHLAKPEARDNLLKYIYESGEFTNPKNALRNGSPKGFFPYESL